MKEDDAVIFTQGSLVPDIGRYSPPEVVKNGWDSVRRNPTHAVDAYSYGILVSEVFNGGFSGTDQIGSTKNIPIDMQNSYKRLTHAAPKMRLSLAHFLEQGSRSGGFFDTPLIQLTNNIDNMGLKSESEKDQFLKYVKLRQTHVPTLTPPQRTWSGCRIRRVSRRILQGQGSSGASQVCRIWWWWTEVVRLGYANCSKAL